MTLGLPPLRADAQYTDIAFAHRGQLVISTVSANPVCYWADSISCHNIVAIEIFIEGSEEEIPGESDFLLVINLRALLEVAKPLLDGDTETLEWEN
jgi:hypothetical protein